MCQNLLQLNADKTEVTVFVLTYNSMSLKATNQARNLGVIIDSDLNFNNHLKAITIYKSAYHHLKNIARIISFLFKQDTENKKTNKKSVRQLQLIQNAATRVLINTRKSDHITSVLKSPHWLE